MNLQGKHPAYESGSETSYCARLCRYEKSINSIRKWRFLSTAARFAEKSPPYAPIEPAIRNLLLVLPLPCMVPRHCSLLSPVDHAHAQPPTIYKQCVWGPWNRHIQFRILRTGPQLQKPVIALKNETTLFPWQLQVMGHFHIKEGMAGPQAGVVGTSPPPPSITIQTNMELDMKTTTEQQGVATTPFAPLQIQTRILSRSNGEKHPQEAQLLEAPPTVVGCLTPQLPRRSAADSTLEGVPKAINLASTLSHPEAIDAELDTEVRAGRVLGPFPLRPSGNLRTSGLGVVPKENGKLRVILHLSAPEGHSVNDFISREEFTLHYSTIHHVVALLGRLNRGALMATLLDLQAAFRMVPVLASKWELLGMYWRDKYYVESCLPFGLHSAPSIFDNFASALHWILQHNYGVTLLHWLVVPAGRLFLHRLIHLSIKWDRFLPSWNGVAMFIAPDWRDADSVNLYTDASGSLGFGAYFNEAWIRGHWQPPNNHQLAPYSGMGQPVLQTLRNMDLLRTLFLTAAQHSFTVSLAHLPGRLNSITDALSRNQMSRLLHPCPTSQPMLHISTFTAGRALEDHLQLLITRAVAPSTSSTYRAGTRRYISFCQAYGLQSLPGSKHTIVLFVVHLSRTLQANTIQGFSSPTSSNPMLNLTIRGIQRSQAPAHLRPRRLPLTNTMLDRMFGIRVHTTPSLPVVLCMMTLHGSSDSKYWSGEEEHAGEVGVGSGLGKGHGKEHEASNEDVLSEAKGVKSKVYVCSMKTWINSSRDNDKPDHHSMSEFHTKLQDYAKVEMVDPDLASDTGSSQFTMSGPRASVSASNALQARIWCTVADVFLKVGKTSDALSCVREAQFLAPHFPSVLLSYGRVMQASDNEKASGELYRSALALQPTNPIALTLIGQLKYHSKRYDQAEKYLQEATAVDQLNHEALYWLGEVFSSQGHKELAANCYRTALDLELTAPLQPFSVVLSSLVPSSL
eukprot:Em0001g1726a